jgi:hypothetical protein
MRESVLESASSTSSRGGQASLAMSGAGAFGNITGVGVKDGGWGPAVLSGSISLSQPDRKQKGPAGGQCRTVADFAAAGTLQ